MNILNRNIGDFIEMHSIVIPSGDPVTSIEIKPASLLSCFYYHKQGITYSSRAIPSSCSVLHSAMSKVNLTLVFFSFTDLNWFYSLILVSHVFIDIVLYQQFIKI
jgi:hypothetical protein